MKLDNEDVEDISKSTSVRGNNARAPIGGTKFKKELISFMRMIAERCDNNDPKARYISSYNANNITEHYLTHIWHLQNSANTSIQVQAPSQARYVKSETESIGQLGQREERQDRFSSSKG